MIRCTDAIEPRLRLVGGGAPAFGPGKAELLGLIGKTGSIRSAATQMSMSYNRAWTLVREINRLFKQPLVVAARGGVHGGGAKLTRLGRTVHDRYIGMEESCRAATRSDWRALRRHLRR